MPHSVRFQPPFAKLSAVTSDHIVRVFNTKEDLVKVEGFGTFSNASRQVNKMRRNGDIIHVTWKECPRAAQEEYVRQGGLPPPSYSLNKNAKRVHRLDATTGRVLKTFDSMKNATIAAGATEKNSYHCLKRAIAKGERWMGCNWTFE
jgi:hypothetical protein